MNLYGILAWFASSLGARVLASLGMGFISYASVTTAANALIASFSTTWGQIPDLAFRLLSLAGFPDAIGWIIGAVLAKLTITTAAKLGRIPQQ